MSDNIFICKICNKSFSSIHSFVIHLRNEHNHLTSKEYYDTYLKTPNEGICPICGKNTKYHSLTFGYKQYCSVKCSTKSEKTREKYKNTCIKKYGVDSTNKLNTTKIKAKETCIKKYGTEYASQSELFKNNSRKTCLEKYGVEYSFQSENNKEKTKQTFLEKYGNEYYTKTEDFKNKFKQTCQSRYNVDAPAQLDSVKEKYKNTCLTKYGVVNPVQNDEIKEKIKQTCIEKYGVDNPIKNIEVKNKCINTCQEKYGKNSYMETDEFRNKSIKTCLEKYGVNYAAQSHEIQKKFKLKYTYNNINFDSSWELAYYIWLTDNNIDFIYHPNIHYTYSANGKEYYYFPDFKVNDTLIEIKGDHFFDKNNNFRCPFNITNIIIQNRYKAKYQCMLDNNIKIIRKNEIRNILYYIKKTYGQNYLKLFKNYK